MPISVKVGGPSLYYVSTFLEFFRFTHPTSAWIVLNVSKKCHFFIPPTQYFCWRNIGMVPNMEFTKSCCPDRVMAKTKWEFLCQVCYCQNFPVFKKNSDATFANQLQNWGFFLIENFCQKTSFFVVVSFKSYANWDLHHCSNLLWLQKFTQNAKWLNLAIPDTVYKNLVHVVLKFVLSIFITSSVYDTSCKLFIWHTICLCYIPSLWQITGIIWILVYLNQLPLAKKAEKKSRPTAQLRRSELSCPSYTWATATCMTPCMKMRSNSIARISA